MPNVLHVTLPANIFDFLDYEAPSEEVSLGARVKVLFRGKVVIGLVFAKSFVEKPVYKLQPILEVIDVFPVLSDKLLGLMKWLSDYYQSSLSDVYKVMLPKKLRQGESASLPFVYYYQHIENAKIELSKQAKKQKECLNFIAESQTPVLKKTCNEQGFSASILNSLVDKGVIECLSQEKAPEENKQFVGDVLNLNQEQQASVGVIEQSLNQFKAFLLFGVTGSGKTEVYFHVMQQVLSQDKQVLVLVPEIGLTPQFLNRVMKRFSQSVALLHSKLNDSERLHNWLWCKNGKAKILIGTRSAVFTPFSDLGLIIVDEEHDLSFKQQEGMRFSGRDVALKRAFDLNIPIILGSATPALESMHNAKTGKYCLLHLRQQAATLSNTFYRIIDLRNKPLIDGLCTSTLNRINEHLNKQQQVLVFINRRGYAPILICHQCGWMANCRHCSAHLTVHAQEQSMKCHHCGYKQHLALQCGDCHSRELIPVGAGTERLASYLIEAFPNHNVMRIDRDTTKGKSDLQASLQSVDSGKVDILVGTQLLAKGHHFKKLTLAVLVDADAGFYSQDFRAIERLGQIVTQVAGRAGREGEGEVVVQTHHPDNDLLNTLIQQGYEAFSQALLDERRLYQWPPYTYLALCRAQDYKTDKVINFFLTVKNYLISLELGLTLLGPAPAPMEKKAGLFQLQLLIRSDNRNQLLTALKSLRLMLRSKAQRKLVANLRFSIDVDPQDLS